MQTRNDVDDYRPILRGLCALVLYASRRERTIDEAYASADVFVQHLSEDIDEDEAKR